MARVFTEDGASVPVTVIEMSPNRVTQVKTVDSDGYLAVQVTMGDQHRSRLTKAQQGVFAKAGVDAGSGLWELEVSGDAADLKVGQDLRVDLFKQGQYVDVSGTTIGRGFAGVIRRHNFSSGDATHGNSLSHRTPGSTGQRQTPGRVFKGKRMAGHMGNVKATVQSLEIVRVDVQRNILLVKGAVPGARNGLVTVRRAKKIAAKGEN